MLPTVFTSVTGWWNDRSCVKICRISKSRFFREAVFRNPAKALSTTERTVKGNYYVMNPCSNEDASRYNARYFMEKVVADYEDIAKEGGEDTCVPFLGR